MVRPNWLRNPKQTNLFLEGDDLLEVKSYLGNKSLSEYIRRLIKADLEQRKTVQPTEKVSCLSSEIRDTTANEYLLRAFNNMLDTDGDIIRETLMGLPEDRREEIGIQCYNIRLAVTEIGEQEQRAARKSKEEPRPLNEEEYLELKEIRSPYYLEQLMEKGEKLTERQLEISRRFDRWGKK